MPTRTKMTKQDDLLSSLTFVPLSELEKDKGDRMETVRSNFIKMLLKQKEYAQKSAENPERKHSKDEKPIFIKRGSKYSIEPRYGRRKVALMENNAIVVSTIEEVVSVIEKIISSTRSKSPSIDAALTRALERKKKEDKPNPTPAGGSPASSKGPKTAS